MSTTRNIFSRLKIFCCGPTEKPPVINNPISQSMIELTDHRENFAAIMQLHLNSPAGNNNAIDFLSRSVDSQPAPENVVIESSVLAAPSAVKSTAAESSPLLGIYEKPSRPISPSQLNFGELSLSSSSSSSSSSSTPANKKITDKITLGKLIGEGNRSYVYTAMLNGQPYAVKKYREHNFAAIKAFHEECRVFAAITALNIPSVVKYHGYAIPDPKTYYIVMELIGSGQDLYDWLKDCNENSTPIPWIMRFKILDRIAEILIDLYKHNVAHADLKAENFLLAKPLDPNDPDAIVDLKLVDTEFAVILGSEESKIVGPTARGTHRYTAPEVIKECRYSTASDIFAFGMMMYVFGNMASPYWEKEVSEDNDSELERAQFINYVRTAILNNQEPTISEECRPELATLMRQCWSARRADRPSANDLHLALSELAQNERKHSPSY